MYITSKHLKIVKFLQGKKDINIELMSTFFNTTGSNLMLVFREIYKHLDEKRNLKKIGEIINFIQNHKGSLFLLKQEQHFRKRERRDFIIFSLLIKKIIKLNDIAVELDVSRRIINYDLEKVKKFLKKFSLEIASTNKGIVLKGKKEAKENIVHLFLFKFFLEKNYLPKKTRSLYYSFFKDYNLKKVIEDLNLIIEVMGGKYTLYERYAFYAFYLMCLSRNSSGKTIKDLESFTEFKNILNLNLTENKLMNIYFFLKKNEYLQKIPLRMLKKFKDLIIRIYPRNFYDNEYYIELTIRIKTIFEKNYNVQIKELEEFINRVVSWVEFCDYKKKLDIASDDFFAIPYNKFSVDMLKTLNEIKEFLPRFSVHDLTVIYFTTKDLFQDKTNEKKIVFIYKYVPRIILNHLKSVIKNEYNIKCDDSIYIGDFNKYKIKNQIDLAIIVEDLKIDSVKTLKLDFPEF